MLQGEILGTHVLARLLLSDTDTLLHLGLLEPAEGGINDVISCVCLDGQLTSSCGALRCVGLRAAARAHVALQLAALVQQVLAGSLRAGSLVDARRALSWLGKEEWLSWRAATGGARCSQILPEPLDLLLEGISRSLELLVYLF